MNRALIARAAAAACMAVTGFVHFRIWQHEYRHAPVREMFVAHAAVSALLVVALVVHIAARRRPGSIDRSVLVGGLVFSLASLLAFALSRGPGLPTLHGSFKEHGLETTAAYVLGLGSAKVALVAETAAGWSAPAARQPGSAAFADSTGRGRL